MQQIIELVKNDKDVANKPPREYLAYKRIKELKSEFLVSALYEDFLNLSSSRDYFENYPLNIKISDIKSFIDLDLSIVLDMKYEKTKSDIKDFIFAIKDIDNFYVNFRAKKINEQRNKINNKGK